MMSEACNATKMLHKTKSAVKNKRGVKYAVRNKSNKPAAQKNATHRYAAKGGESTRTKGVQTGNPYAIESLCKGK